MILFFLFLLVFLCIEILSIFYPKKFLGIYYNLLCRIKHTSSEFDNNVIAHLEKHPNFTLWAIRISCMLMIALLIVIIIDLW